MKQERGAVINTLHTAREDLDSVVALTSELVRVPSRGGIDPYDPVLDCVGSWLGERGLTCQRLTGPGRATVALVCEITGQPGPRYVLDACLDTAAFGDEAAWKHSPTSGLIDSGWLHGRGASDSKAAVAIFAHIGAHLRENTDRLHGSVVLLFDIDEHTGVFGGAKAYFEGPGAPEHVDGVMIGYPGLDHLVIGGRGVLRARAHVHGVASHSGGSRPTPSAISKATELVQALNELPLPHAAGEAFPLPAKLTVTAINGGEGFSTVPDLCSMNIDVRLTPALDDATAANLLRSRVAEVDQRWKNTQPTQLEITTRWPAFALPDTSPMAAALIGAAREVGLATKPKIAGPSNIGNYLAGLGIPATAGFGVEYEGLHATDERIRIESMPVVQAVYHQALLELLRPA